MIWIISSMRGPRDSQSVPGALEVLEPGAETDAQAEALAGEHVQGAHLLGDQERMPDRKLEHARVKVDALGHGGHGGEELEGIEEGRTVEEAAVASLRVGIIAYRFRGIEDTVAERERAESGLFSCLGERQVVADVAHRLADGEAHAGTPFRLGTRCYPESALEGAFEMTELGTGPDRCDGFESRYRGRHRERSGRPGLRGGGALALGASHPPDARWSAM